MAFQEMNAATIAGSSTNYNSRTKFKQEPVLAVGTRNGGTRKQPFKRENNNNKKK